MSAQLPIHTVNVKKEEIAGVGDNAPQYDYFPLRACKKEEVEETRYHIMKFHSVKKINPEKDFEEPTRLHRKDPKNLQFQMSMKELEQKKIDDKKNDILRAEKRKEYIDKKGMEGKVLTQQQVDEKMELDSLSEEERSRRLEEKKREEEEERRRIERENQMKLVAPDGGARKMKRQILKKKTRQIRAYDETKRRLRYEEFYPWVLEDYDAEQAWVGNYEAGNMDNYCLLVLDNENKCFKLVPLEKFYRFTPRNKYATLTLEEAEAKMNKGSTGQRWLMRKMAEEVATGQRIDLRYRKVHKSGPTIGLTEEGRKTDDEDMDFDDEFQDDEEAPIMEGNEEENKMVEGKMKKNMLRANNLIEHSEEDESDLDDLFETRKVDKEGKKLRKALAQNAINEVYDTDDEENNPYLSDSEIEKEESDDNEDKIVTIKKENGENGELEDVTVKEEPGVGDASAVKRQISVFKYEDGEVVLKASKNILSQFPEGDWNPTTAIRREHGEGGPPLKKIKLKLKSPSPVESSSSYEISRADVDELLSEGPIPLTTLVRSLRIKMSKDPNARSNLKRVLKEHFVLKSKKVYRRREE
ncbi:DEKNAAC105322 [Brettanomyces naardenensis]|uniref:DEKNAAC105322 n=1 Tax=Brettanomyces naardenensis TaxID=13370 RepID=A0A448YTL0_BRENA|nr:DEKNAAC105322 [Brettanomyces naardenensis]